MRSNNYKAASHGTGEFSPMQLSRIGENVIFENGVLVFHPENIEMGSNIYIGHYTILKGYYQNRMVIGDNTWIGQQCFLHSAGGLIIGCAVGVGPGVKIVTSVHNLEELDKPILHSSIDFAPVQIGDDSDIGTGAIILPGVSIGRGVQIGAGAVVTSNIEDYAIAVGVPARIIRKRREISRGS
jgi:acetyltransferase-like isoleucine patch superfamily enzyme